MFQRSTWAAALGSFLALLALVHQAYAADYYISPNGSDQNPGTQSQPFVTIAHGDGVAQPGDTIHVAPGVYPGDLITQASGTSSAHVRFVSDSKWGAKLVAGSTGMIWYSKGAYVDVIGFEIDGTASTVVNLGIYLTGSYSSAQNHEVHDRLRPAYYVVTKAQLV